MIELREKLVEFCSSQCSQASTMTLAMTTSSKDDPHGAYNRTLASRQRYHVVVVEECLLLAVGSF